MKVAAIGLGYVGTVTAACLASRGHDVWGVDVDAAKVDEIRGGRSPVAEPGLDALVAQAVADGTLHATMSCTEALDGADVSLVCVGTPSTARGGTDLSYIRRAVDDIAAAVRIVGPPASGQHSVVIRSTVPPGTVEDVVVPALTAGLAGTEITIGAAMCPEFLREGSGIADFFASPFAGRRDRRPPRRRGGHRLVRLPRPAHAGRRRPRRGGAQVRLQRLPCHQGVLHQRGVAAVPALGCGFPRGHVPVLRGPGPQHLGDAISAPASPSADPACPRISGPCCIWPG